MRRVAREWGGNPAKEMHTGDRQQQETSERSGGGEEYEEMGGAGIKGIKGENRAGDGKEEMNRRS